ncbi:MAG: DMT family transporter, partial [Anaerolineales bacterium]
RLSMLMMSLAPVISTILAWVFMDEYLSGLQILGIGLTLGGIAWVVLERNGKRENRNRNDARGILFGLGAALGQSFGLVLAKNGLYGGFSPISANLIRMLTAMLVLWFITIFQRKTHATFQVLNTNRQALIFLSIGVIAGPFLGVSLSLLAVQKTALGVASTLMALPPVFLLPISFFFFKERFGWGAIAGTFVAVAGVAMLFLV